MTINFDTGIPLTMIPLEDCVSCQGKRFNNKLSTTFKKINGHFEEFKY